MKNLIYTFLFAIVLSVSFVSCEQAADIDLPETEPKLVVTCFISPQDTLIIARINRSKPVFQASTVNPSFSVDNATVILAGNSTSVQLTYDADFEWYYVSPSQFQVLPGATYTITVTTPEGESVNASTTIPVSVPQNYTVTVTSEILDSNSFGLNEHYMSDNAWTDLAGQTDFYRLIWVSVRTNAFLPGDTLYSTLGGELISDKNNDGGQIRLLSDGYQFQNTTDTTIAMDFHLVHATPEYYLYHQSVQNYGGDNPFAEPTLIYTNVTDGLGVFAGYNSVKRRVLL
ncbi:MAG: hypothetical protein FD123_2274 [Bacteroidetes bacterium]|nr:MAG: hypothetical protein FD123_2274 [Bacteroidota bacterium]